MDNLSLFLRESNAIEDVWDEQSLIDAKKAWDYLIGKDKLTIVNILKCHGILMKKHLPKNQRGCFRAARVWIGAIEGMEWVLIPGLINKWLIFANLNLMEEKKWHIEFERIHPFIDGNGRTGRIILNWMRVKSGRPILVIYEKEKKKYYEWFKL